MKVESSQNFDIFCCTPVMHDEKPVCVSQELGGNATLLFYQTPEGNEGLSAYKEKRPPDFSRFPRFP